MAPDLISQSVEDEIIEKLDELDNATEEAKIEALNSIKKKMGEISPMSTEPADCVIWVDSEKVEANDYNPNNVAPPEMKLLEKSVEEDGFTQPIVCWEREDGTYEVVDGFHRNLVAQQSDTVRKRLDGKLPITIINEENEDREQRMASTIRHNRARGEHQVQDMSEIVVELSKRNWSEERIGRDLGMDPDEVLRLKQVRGLADNFENENFSQAWKAEKN